MKLTYENATLKHFVQFVDREAQRTPGRPIYNGATFYDCAVGDFMREELGGYHGSAQDLARRFFGGYTDFMKFMAAPTCRGDARRDSYGGLAEALREFPEVLEAIGENEPEPLPVTPEEDEAWKELEPKFTNPGTIPDPVPIKASDVDVRGIKTVIGCAHIIDGINASRDNWMYGLNSKHPNGQPFLTAVAERKLAAVRRRMHKLTAKHHEAALEGLREIFEEE